MIYLIFGMIIDIGSKFYSALSPSFDLEIKVTDFELKSQNFTSKFLRIQIGMEDVLHPKFYPVPCLPFPSNPHPLPIMIWIFLFDW